MLFAIDIDGTISYTLIEGYTHYVLERLRIYDITDEMLATCSRQDDFWQLPALQQWLSGSSTRRAIAHRVRQEAQHDMGLQRASQPMPGALAGIKSLAERGDIIYITCRKKESKELTSYWLHRYGFPFSQEVYICEDGYYQKLHHARQQARSDEPIIIIDNQAKDVMGGFITLGRHYDKEAALSLLPRLRLYAFGISEAPTWPVGKSVFPVIAFPDWKDVQRILEDGNVARSA